MSIFFFSPEYPPLTSTIVEVRSTCSMIILFISSHLSVITWAINDRLLPRNTLSTIAAPINADTIPRRDTARSPMAVGILKDFELKHPVDIESRGMVVLFPEPINQKVEAVLISNGVATNDFMSVQLTEEDFTMDTLILTMEYIQKEKILENGCTKVRILDIR